MKLKAIRPKKTFHQKKSKKNLITGNYIEQKACQWLKQQGLQLLQRNYLCRYGEIDIVMIDTRQLVFVEVRYRKHISYGGAAVSVDWRKQKKLLRAAEFFLSSGGKLAEMPCRFDVIAAQANTNNGKIHWTWIKDAFGID